MNVKFELPNMKRLACLVPLLAVVALPAHGTQWSTNITGPLPTPPPNFDVVNITNNSQTFRVSTSPYPFDTSNTRNFVNNGTMIGSVGFRFDEAPRDSGGNPVAPRKLAENFVNNVNASVSAPDLTTLLIATNLVVRSSVSYLWVQATNINSKGVLQVGAAGDMQITGTNVNLARSGVGVYPMTGQGSQNYYPAPPSTNYLPDIAIYDRYWGQTNMNLFTPGILTFDPAGLLTRATAPSHGVTFPGGINGAAGFAITSGIYDAYTNNAPPPTTVTVTNIDGSQTNIILFTNIVRQLAVVGFTDPNMSASVSWIPSTIATNYMRTVAVELTVPEFDPISSQATFSTLYFQDTLASQTNRGVLRNAITGPNTAYPIPTYRPANYLLSRIVEDVGDPGNATLNTNFLYQRSFTNQSVQAEYAGYSAWIDYLNSRPPAIPAAAPTNYPGRVNIKADSLDLTRTRVRAEGLLTIDARHLVGSSNAVVDSTAINYNLGSTNGNLVMQNLMTETVARLNGTNYAWSATWSNSYQLILTNYDTATNPAVLAPITNTITVNLHVLLLNADVLANVVPVNVYQLKLHSTNVVLKDNGVVSKDFLVDGRSFTLDGRLRLSGAVSSWTAAQAPTLRYFTNNGTLIIPGSAHFGDDGPTNYLTFVNRGTITSQGQTINSDYTEFNGTNTANGAISVTAKDVKVEAAEVDASVQIDVSANTLKFNASTVNSSGPLLLMITNSLFDNGPGSGNAISFRNGCTLYPKPATGDLLGTSFLSFAPQFAEVDHYWSGQDRGASRVGYSNNVALGRLTLSPEGLDPLFYFAGTSVSNALYVDLFDLSQLTDFTNQLAIAPNLVIYYAAAQINFTPPGGQTVEEFLNGQFDGHLRWVSDYAGANSTVDVVINGNQTIKMNAALRNSQTIDSDADGIPNFFDPTPLDGVKFTSIKRNTSPAGYLLTWASAAGTVYRVEYKTNLTGAPWVLALTVTNNWATNGPLTALDTSAGPATVQRYYRVTYNPNGQ